MTKEPIRKFLPIRGVAISSTIAAAISIGETYISFSSFTLAGLFLRNQKQPEYGKETPLLVFLALVL